MFSVCHFTYRRKVIPAAINYLIIQLFSYSIIYLWDMFTVYFLSLALATQNCMLLICMYLKLELFPTSNNKNIYNFKNYIPRKMTIYRPYVNKNITCPVDETCPIFYDYYFTFIFGWLINDVVYFFIFSLFISYTYSIFKYKHMQLTCRFRRNQTKKNIFHFTYTSSYDFR